MSGDCAAIAWWSANAVSAAGYLLAAGTLTWGTIAGRLPRHSLVLAAAVALEGVGSILAHGTGGDGAILVHDLALLAMVGYVAGWHLGRLCDRALDGAVTGAVSATLVGAAAWPWYPGGRLAGGDAGAGNHRRQRSGCPEEGSTGGVDRPVARRCGRRRSRLVRRAHRQPAVRSGIAAAGVTPCGTCSLPTWWSPGPSERPPPTPVEERGGQLRSSRVRSIRFNATCRYEPSSSSATSPQSTSAAVRSSASHPYAPWYGGT